MNNRIRQPEKLDPLCSTETRLFQIPCLLWSRSRCWVNTSCQSASIYQPPRMHTQVKGQLLDRVFYFGLPWTHGKELKKTCICYCVKPSRVTRHSTPYTTPHYTIHKLLHAPLHSIYHSSLYKLLIPLSTSHSKYCSIRHSISLHI